MSRASRQRKRNIRMGSFFSLFLLFCFVCLTSACGSTTSLSNEVVYVFNWGDYVDPDMLDAFTEETGIQVILDEFDTNEDMYPKVASGASEYDVLCPSDYMIRKMIDQDLLRPLEYDLLPQAAAYIDPTYMEQASAFDPDNAYAVPYCWGTVGIMVNTAMVKEPVASWDILWDPAYTDEILMQDSVRDTFMVALRRLGYSVNTTDKGELEEALALLIEQKPLVQAYVIDEVRDKMVSGESALGVVFSGEALWMILANPDLSFVIPEEGSNLWIDAWVIPKNARHVENAHRFIDFMCRPEVAARNCEYLTYSTPNREARTYIEDEDILSSPELFPDLSTAPELETYSYLGEEMDRVYTDYWIRLKSAP